MKMIRYIRTIGGKQQVHLFPDTLKRQTLSTGGWYPAPEPEKFKEVDEITGEVTIDEMPEPHAAKIGRPKKIK